MPRFYPEGNLSLPSDNEMRSLHKLVDLFGGSGSGGAGVLSPEVFSGNYGGASPTQTPSGSSAVAYDLDAPHPVWYWNGSAWF